MSFLFCLSDLTILPFVIILLLKGKIAIVKFLIILFNQNKIFQLNHKNIPIKSRILQKNINRYIRCAYLQLNETHSRSQ